ncbi:MAG: amino acid ABC transporter permease [Desulfurococcaceae archaeon]|nr:amino acid ABC transporter permease [Desulfurococcaceae archaeon]
MASNTPEIPWWLSKVLEVMWQNFVQYVPIILSALSNTLILAFFSFGLATVLGIVMAFAEVFTSKTILIIVSWVARVLRGVPLILSIFLVFYGLPKLGLTLPPLYAAILGIAIVDAGYQEQIFRGAIKAVSNRQLEAAYSLGLTRASAFLYVVLPQAFRIALPSWINDFTIVLKDTSIAYAIGVVEMFTQAIHVAQVIMDYMWPLVFVALIYLAICYPLSMLSNYLHSKLKMMGMLGSGV